RGHLLFDFAALLFLALDIYVPADQLAGQANVLALFADGKRELGIFHDDFELVIFRVRNLDAGHFRGTQSFLRKRNRLFVVWNDVNLFTAQLTDNRLHAHALHTNASADRVNIFIAAEHGDLRAFASFAGSGTNLHGSVVNFGHFHFKKPLDEGRICTRNDNLRTLSRAVDHFDDHAQALADVVSFEF